MLTLLTLPIELRTQIWNLVFRDQHVTVEPRDSVKSPECIVCASKVQTPLQYQQIFQQLLTCKQIYNEAYDILHSSFRFHLTTSLWLERIYSTERKLRTHVKRLILTLHLDDDNRMEWITSLYKLSATFPNLQHLMVYYHMRPPVSYEYLVDGVFVAAPLVVLPPPPQIVQDLHFDYISEEVMFESPFLGEIRCSDAIEEHTLVVLDLLRDDAFRRGAEGRDLNLMTAAMLRVARAHEQPWFATLQHRRLQQLQQEREATGGEEAVPETSTGRN